ncbi:chromate efflux transporter [Octadecabacter sp. SW4]|uniref:chromate efflux transporter n=1 Tax=Octadecabacter sp. SW4 TaxID=2602067 RepID=UPI00155B22E7|nr:chromate efflux transporter [Octadecabacter sp. SW4]
MISWGDMARVFGRIGVLSFGGPAAQIALMHKELVEDRPWLTEPQFLRALSFCMLLPGPEAMQLATYSGWRMRGIAGGLLAGGLFVIPGALVIFALAFAYAAYGNLPLVQAGFVGIKATVVVIVIEAILRIARKALRGPPDWAIAALAFIGLFALNLPFPLIIGVAAVYGALTSRAGATGTPTALPWGKSLRVIAIGGLIWAAPLLLIRGAPFLTDIWVFFSTLAVVTFGGAYAVLAYMTQVVVVDFGWIDTAQMMDALGLAETTPGPLILVTQFVAFQSGLGLGGPWLAVQAAVLALWVTFVPCFIWIFAGAPLIDWLEGRPRVAGALSAITAAIVGVIANLSLWFAVHLLFAQTGSLGRLNLLWPVWSSLDWAALGLVVLAGAMMLVAQRGLVLTLVVTALAGVAIGII